MKRIILSFLFLTLTLGLWSQVYRNPVIGGFHPDPSICRVGSDYYLVNSSFQYFPGVPIFHSTDLVHWRQIGNVLTRDSQLPLKGASSWLGIYAPTLRYHDGTYYMITTNVGNGGNFIVTATNPSGPWSEPIWLQQQGIDPSLFFEDGKCYMMSNPDNTIMLCEIDPKTGRQLTESRALWRGMGGRYPEGPHIYKKDGWYYLLISEGGTELAHHLTIARSRDIYGLYEGFGGNPILTNCNMKGQSMQIQGTGHGDFVQAADSSWWVVFLAYRHFGGSYHHLGRETCLAPMEWKMGEWPVVYDGNAIDTVMKVSNSKFKIQDSRFSIQDSRFSIQDSRFSIQDSAMSLQQQEGMPGDDGAWGGQGRGHRSYTFERVLLGPEWIHIQNPIAANYRFGGGLLTLTGHGTLSENRQPTFLGQRQCDPELVAETTIDLTTLKADDTVPLRCGLTVYQINDGHLDLYTDGKRVRVACRLKTLDVDVSGPEGGIAVPRGTLKLTLRVTSDGNLYRFLYAFDHGHFTELAAQSCTLVSTEVAGGFTGVTVGMFAEGGKAGFTGYKHSEGRP